MIVMMGGGQLRMVVGGDWLVIGCDRWWWLVVVNGVRVGVKEKFSVSFDPKQLNKNG